MFILLLITNIIRKNPIKILTIIVMFGTIPFINCFSDTKKEISIAKEMKFEGKYIYLIRDDMNDEVSFDVKTFNKKQKLKNGIYLVEDEFNPANIPLYILFGVCVILILISSILNDTDSGWDLRGSRERTISHFITCEEEDGEFYYLYKDKLLKKTSKIFDNNYNNIAYQLGICSISEIRKFPIWRSKKRIRDDKLTNIGV